MEKLNVLKHFTDIAKGVIRNRKSKERHCNGHERTIGKSTT
jgi:hypothetical protein